MIAINILGEHLSLGLNIFYFNVIRPHMNLVKFSDTAYRKKKVLQIYLLLIFKNIGGIFFFYFMLVMLLYVTLYDCH